MRKTVAIFTLIIGWPTAYCHAGWLTPETAVLAQQAFPVASGAINDINALSKSLTGLLHLPKGAAQLGLSPLPGPTMKGGVKDISRGVMATTGFVENTLKLPLNLLNRSVNRIGNFSPLSFAGK